MVLKPRAFGFRRGMATRMQPERRATIHERSQSPSGYSDEEYWTARESMSKAVRALKGGLTGLTKTDPGDDGFSTIVREGKVKRKVIPRTREECERFSALFNNYVMAVYGKRINFIITPSSQPYVSALEACMERDHVLVTLFEKRPKIVDVYGGSGSDAFALLLNTYPRLYIACDHCTPGNETQEEEWTALRHNLDEVRLAFKELQPYSDGVKTDAPIVETIMKDAKEFLMELPMESSIDILYLDPSWNIGNNSKYELDPRGLVAYLDHNVIVPLKERNIQPKCIVFKTRWASTILMPFMNLLNTDYHSMYSIEATPFREYVDEERFKKTGEIEGRFHWIIIVHNELKNIVWQKSKLFMDVVRRGARVIIRKKDLLHPYIPEYARKRVIPNVQDHEDGDETFVVEGVPFVHRLPAHTRNTRHKAHVP